MPPHPASQSELYPLVLTALDGADGAVDVIRNLPDQQCLVKKKPEDLVRVIAHIHGLGLHLVLARELRDPGSVS